MPVMYRDPSRVLLQSFRPRESQLVYCYQSQREPVQKGKGGADVTGIYSDAGQQKKPAQAPEGMHTVL